MIKFLRKIRQNLLSDGKIGKYVQYAIGEIVLVVIGILIALQVNNWNEERNRKKEEIQYLITLQKDFKSAEFSFRQILGLVQEQLDHNGRLIKILSKTIGSTPKDSIVGMLRKSFIDIPFGVQVPAYHDLVNSGKLSIIQNEELRRALSNFEIINELANAYAEKAAAQWAGQVTEFFIKNFNVSFIYGSESDVHWDYPGTSPSTGYKNTPVNRRITSDEDALWGRELTNRIAIKNVLLEDAARSAKDILRLMEEIYNLINISLDSKYPGKNTTKK